MSILQEYHNYDAIALAEFIRQKEITPLELLETAIARAETINSKINAITTKMYAHARTLIKQNKLSGPFAGVPFLLKDLGLFYQGVATTHGSRLFQNEIPDYNSELTNRFNQAGFISFGKTNTPEFGLSFTTEPNLFGPCRNPWDFDRIAGGSSGGAAAAVAAGIVPVAHASDGGGSIRVPAACCGLFGLKPTRARVPKGPDAGEGWAGLSTGHVISHSVRDSAAILDAISGPDVGDPYYAPPQTETFLNAMQRAPKKLNIAFSTQAPRNLPVDPACKQAVEQAALLCEELGHCVTEAKPNYDQKRLTNVMFTIVGANVAMMLDMRQETLKRNLAPDDIEPVSWLVYEYGKKIKASEYAKAILHMHQQSRLIAAFYQNYDVMITPTTAQLPAKIGELHTDFKTVEDYFIKLFAFAPFTGICNQTGQPAMSVPLYWTQNKLPVGVHFIGRFGDENTLFQLAHQLEQARPCGRLNNKQINAND